VPGLVNRSWGGGGGGGGGGKLCLCVSLIVYQEIMILLCLPSNACTPFKNIFYQETITISTQGTEFHQLNSQGVGVLPEKLGEV